MEVDRSSYKLDTNEFNHALSVLKQEQIPLNKFNKISYILLNISAYGFVIILIVSLIIATLATLNDSKPNGIWFNLITLNSVLLGLTAVSIPIIFLCNLPLLKKIRRQIKFSVEYNFTQLINYQLIAIRKRRRIINLLTILASIFGLLIIVGGFTVGFERYGFIGGVLTLLFSCLVGGSIIATYFIRRGKEKLDILINSLESLKKTTDGEKTSVIDIPFDEYESIAQIERTQVFRSRQQRILNSEAESKSIKYYLQKSHPVKQFLNELDANERLFIEDQINSLISEPIPSDSWKEAKGELYELFISKLGVKISYQIDESNHSIKILTLNRIENNPTSQPKIGDY